MAIRTRVFADLRSSLQDSVAAAATGAGTLVIPMLGRRTCELWLWPTVALLTFASYSIDHLADRPSSAAPGGPSALETTTPWRTQATLAVFAFVLSLVVAWAHAGWIAATSLLVFPLAVYSYSVPVLGGPGRLVRRMKDVPYLKAPYTAFFWSLLGGWVALMSLGPDPWPMGLAASFIGLRCFVNTVYCDVKDVEEDRRAGVRTIVLALGVPRTLLLLHALNSACALAIVAAVASKLAPVAALGLTFGCVYMAAVLVAASRPGADHRRLAVYGADAEWLTWPLGVLLVMGAQ